MARITNGGLKVGGGASILRMPQIRHMKELVNRGQTSNARYRIVKASTRRRGR